MSQGKKYANRSTKATQQEYEVQQIKNVRTLQNGHKQYLIKWLGYQDKYNTWQPLENLTGIQKWLNIFQADRKHKKKGRKSKQKNIKDADNKQKMKLKQQVRKEQSVYEQENRQQSSLSAQQLLISSNQIKQAEVQYPQECQNWDLSELFFINQEERDNDLGSFKGQISVNSLVRSKIDDQSQDHYQKLLQQMPSLVSDNHKDFLSEIPIQFQNQHYQSPVKYDTSLITQLTNPNAPPQKKEILPFQVSSWHQDIVHFKECNEQYSQTNKNQQKDAQFIIISSQNQQVVQPKRKKDIYQHKKGRKRVKLETSNQVSAKVVQNQVIFNMKRLRDRPKSKSKIAK